MKRQVIGQPGDPLFIAAIHRAIEGPERGTGLPFVLPEAMAALGPVADCRLSAGMNSKRKRSTLPTDSFEVQFTDDATLDIKFNGGLDRNYLRLLIPGCGYRTKSNEETQFKKSNAFQRRRDAGSSIDLPCITIAPAISDNVLT